MNTTSSVLAFGAHPDDVEFGCGGVLVKAAASGRAVHLVVCSRGESGTHGTPALRTQEATRAAELMGATIEFIELGGDSHFAYSVANCLKLAAVIRERKPGTVLTTTTVENQHPDHAKLGRMTRDASRLARYGGVKELQALAPHTIGRLFYYAVTPEAEPREVTPVLVDISTPETVRTWKAAMEAHHSQTSARAYVELQLTRARLWGMRAGVEHAMALFPNDPLLVNELP